jgi:hypothetical protein
MTLSGRPIDPLTAADQLHANEATISLKSGGSTSKPKNSRHRRKTVMPRFYFPADYGGFTVDDDGEVFSTTAEAEAHAKIVV